MSMYHVKADGSMGRCTAKEGHCPFGGDAGVKHFTSESLARLYAEYVIKTTTDGGKKMKKMKSPKVWPTTEHGCHQATYSGWDCDDTIISAGGYVGGVYIRPYEVDSARLWDRLSEDVRAEMPIPDGCNPEEWNDRILELKQSGHVSDEDAELLEALWVSGEVCDGEVTIYGTDDSVTKMDESDLREMGLDRIDDDDDDDDEEDDEEDEESPTSVTADDDEPKMTTNKWGLKVTTWPTERGVHSASYLGWGGDDDYEIFNAGGYVDGKYIPSHEVYSAGLYDQLSPDVRDEMDSLDGQGTGGATPAEWNGKILELERGGVSPEDEALLDALWIEAESFEGSVTIYGPDDDVAEMDEDDLERYGLRRMDADELWRYGVLVDDDDATEDEDE